MTVKIYNLDEKEVHMMGDYVGVVWPTEKVKKKLKGDDGLTYTAEISVRKTDAIYGDTYPYIDFLDIREDSHEAGEFYEDDDSPVIGGIDVKQAMQIAQELASAIHYIETKGWETK